MAKLEEILPEIRKGRLYTRNGLGRYYQYFIGHYQSHELLDDKWELATKTREISKDEIREAWVNEIEGKEHASFDAFCERLGL